MEGLAYEPKKTHRLLLITSIVVIAFARLVATTPDIAQNKQNAQKMHQEQQAR